MEKIVFSQLKEELFHEKLENGLEVYILPKKEFNKSFATFTTKYGSVDNHFKPLNQKEFTKVPDGIAHFLEHKLLKKKMVMFFSNSQSREHLQMPSLRLPGQLIYSQALPTLKGI